MWQNFLCYRLDCNGILVFAFGRFGGPQNGFLDSVEIGKCEFGVNNIYIIRRANSAFHMNYIFVVKAAHHMGDGMSLTNSAQKFIAQAFTFRGASNQTCNVDKLHTSGNYTLGFNDRGD